MGFKSWRRHHGDAIVAHVGCDDLVQGYRVAVWCEGKAESVTQLPRKFRTLQSAQAAADALARKTFDHRCTMAMCGTWMRWTA